MNSTPSSARRIARSVFNAVMPTYWPTSAARSTSTRCPRRKSPIARYISASNRATVVFPVPGIAEEDEMLGRRDLGQAVALPLRLHLQEGDERVHLLLDRFEPDQRVELRLELLERRAGSCFLRPWRRSIWSARTHSPSEPAVLRSWSPSTRITAQHVVERVHAGRVARFSARRARAGARQERLLSTLMRGVAGAVLAAVVLASGAHAGVERHRVPTSWSNASSMKTPPGRRSQPSSAQPAALAWAASARPPRPARGQPRRDRRPRAWSPRRDRAPPALSPRCVRAAGPAGSAPARKSFVRTGRCRTPRRVRRGRRSLQRCVCARTELVLMRAWPTAL